MYIYGAGGFGRSLPAVLQACGDTIDGFIDRSPRSVEGFTCLGIDDPAIDTSRPVAVGIMNPTVDIATVVAFLKQRGFSEVLSPVGIARRAAEKGAAFEHYWMSARQEHGRSVMLPPAGTNVPWADDKSRHLYDALLRYRETGDTTVIPPPVDEIQYAPLDVPLYLSSGFEFVDLGAYDGDTIRGLLSRRIRPARVYAFEPDPRNFAALADYARTPNAPPMICLPLGIGGGTAQFRFRSDGTTGSAIADDGDAIIQLVTLDDALSGAKPGYIKMDVEGGEADTLRGATRLIQTHKPTLAVALEHKPADLWELPQQVLGLNPDYRLYLRQDGESSTETILYATLEP